MTYMTIACLCLSLIFSGIKIPEYLLFYCYPLSTRITEQSISRLSSLRHLPKPFSSPEPTLDLAWRLLKHFAMSQFPITLSLEAVTMQRGKKQFLSCEQDTNRRQASLAWSKSMYRPTTLSRMLLIILWTHTASSMCWSTTREQTPARP